MVGPGPADEGDVMAYPDNLLVQGERVIVNKRPHWKVLILPTILFIVIIAAGAALATWISKSNWESPQWAYYAIIGVAVVALIILVLVPFVRWRTEHFVITNHHVFFRTGLLSRREHQIPLGQIANMETEVTFWGRLMGYGSLIVESSADQPLKFRNVASLSKVQAQLNQLIRDERERTHRGPERESGTSSSKDTAPQGYQPGYPQQYVAPHRITDSRATRPQAQGYPDQGRRSRAIPHRGSRHRGTSPPRPTNSRPATRRPDISAGDGSARRRRSALLLRPPSSRPRPVRPRQDRPRRIIARPGSAPAAALTETLADGAQPGNPAVAPPGAAVGRPPASPAPPKLPTAPPASGPAAQRSTTRPTPPRASCSPATGSPCWSTTARSSRTACSRTRWPTGCPRTG